MWVLRTKLNSSVRELYTLLFFILLSFISSDCSFLSLLSFQSLPSPSSTSDPFLLHFLLENSRPIRDIKGTTHSNKLQQDKAYTIISTWARQPKGLKIRKKNQSQLPLLLLRVPQEHQAT